jgi:hypothetical protein
VVADDAQLAFEHAIPAAEQSPSILTDGTASDIGAKVDVIDAFDSEGAFLSIPAARAGFDRIVSSAPVCYGPRKASLCAEFSGTAGLPTREGHQQTRPPTTHAEQSTTQRREDRW